MRSSRLHVASAACSTSVAAARSRMAATSPTSCVSTQRTTSAMVRPSSAAATKSGARSFPAVAYQNSPSAVVPSLLAASHRSAADRHASRHSPQPVSGDQVLARAPVAPVGSMHHTWPRRALVPNVWRRRSLLTLAASTGPRHPRIAGTAKLVVLPLCVGPTTTSDWAGSAARPVSRARPGCTPRSRRPGGAPSAATRSGRRSRHRAQRAPAVGPARAPHRPHSPRTLPGDAGEECAAESDRQDDVGKARHGYPAVMAASVSTMDRSVALSRCWTRNDLWPTFHKAMPAPQLWEQIGLGGRQRKKL